MSTGVFRQAIFSKLKETLDARSNPTDRYFASAQRILNPSRNIIPGRGQTEGAARTAMFRDEAETASADVYTLTNLTAVPGVVKDLLAGLDTSKVKVAPHEELKSLDWSDMDAQFGPAVGDDLVSVSWAYGAVAETGTLVLASAPESPTTLNFLPDVHVVVLREEDISPNYEEVWSRLRQDAKARTTNAAALPRTVNWITGPSRTADIEQTLLLGAHGPRKLVIVLIDDQNPEITTA